ncbi:MAG: hypothetical protein V3V28_09130 [Polaribacter sp.]|uniref:hypothetical protein n=1 Tax=Polaribacter sp. TaxID=1920175 RepID=UPI002F35BA48
MKKLITFLIITSFTLNVSAQEWHKGGTLHNKNLLEWKNATEKNKLATTGDWIVTLFNKKRIPLGTLNNIKEKAKEIRKCTNKKINSFKSQNNLQGIKANEIAYKCMKEKKYF